MSPVAEAESMGRGLVVAVLAAVALGCASSATGRDAPRRPRARAGRRALAVRDGGGYQARFWTRFATAAADRAHRGLKPDRGRYVTTRGAATPMESWIAASLDHLAALEYARGVSRPITFANWLTTDPLSHPTEPLSLRPSRRAGRATR
jgi:hypothetical protein